MNVKRGDIFYADLNPVVGCEQGGIRPVLIIQNDIGNLFSPTTIVVPLTRSLKAPGFPTHVHISRTESGCRSDSTALIEQSRTIDKKRLKEFMGHTSDHTMELVNEAILISNGIAQ
jgi:mRNA interferase MazF